MDKKLIILIIIIGVVKIGLFFFSNLGMTACKKPGNRECNHHCKNKHTCGHDCCEFHKTSLFQVSRIESVLINSNAILIIYV